MVAMELLKQSNTFGVVGLDSFSKFCLSNFYFMSFLRQ